MRACGSSKGGQWRLSILVDETTRPNSTEHLLHVQSASSVRPRTPEKTETMTHTVNMIIAWLYMFYTADIISRRMTSIYNYLKNTDIYTCIYGRPGSRDPLLGGGGAQLCLPRNILHRTYDNIFLYIHLLDYKQQNDNNTI